MAASTRCPCRSTCRPLPCSKAISDYGARQSEGDRHGYGDMTTFFWLEDLIVGDRKVRLLGRYTLLKEGRTRST
jgi:hypothetical protein